MKKVLLLLAAIFINVLFANAQVDVLQPTENDALWKITVVDGTGKPRKGDKITFRSKGSDMKYVGLTDENGRIDFLIPEGDSLEVMSQSFAGDSVLAVKFFPVIEGSQKVNYKIIFQFPQEMNLKDVYFDSGKATLQPVSFPSLDNLVEILTNQPNVRIELAGHTDSDGSEKDNQDLSERRTETVKRYLVERGIAADRIETVGYGESMPVTSNESEIGKARNRRTVIRTLQQ